MLTPLGRSGPSRPRRTSRAVRDERGAVAVLSAVISMVLLVVAALVVDLGMTWTRRGDLQQQADQAALFAAEALPAVDEAGRTAVAKRVAHYIACHEVPGQRILEPGIPDCPSSPTSSELDAFATKLVAEGLVSFPSTTQVQVVTPQAEVPYAFAGVTGVEDTVQQKSATAKVSSPGDILPIGLSLQCLATTVNSVGLGAAVDGVLPLSYVTPGGWSSTGAAGLDEPPFEPWQAAYTGVNASTKVQVSDPSLTGTLLRVRVSSPALGTVGSLLGMTRVVLKRGDVTVGPVAATGLTVTTGELVLTLPEEVASTPGTWHVKVRMPSSAMDVLGLTRAWSDQDATFAVPEDSASLVDRLSTTLGGILDLPDFLACGRLLDSPRPRDGGAPSLTRNLQEGLDHPLTRHEAVLQALGAQNLDLLDGSAQHLADVLGSTVAGVLSDPVHGLLGCSSTQYNRLDTEQTWQAAESAGGSPANCVRIRSDGAAGQELTDGLLQDSPSSSAEPGYGRLSCKRAGACPGDTTTLPGFDGRYNDDGFADFLAEGPETVLQSNMFYALDTYLLPGLSLLTPSNTIEEDIYRSPRFGWAPVLSYVDLDAPTAADYPILTFRPVFIDNGTARSLHVLGVDAHRVVDTLGCHLAGSVAQAVDGVVADLGGLDTLVGLLGLDNVRNLLCAGDVDQALHLLSTALGTDMGTEKAGLVVQDGQLKAARFMTIAPNALPPVGDGYDGPLVDYVGVGPKIVRLIR